jgi:hypothetical protein
MVKLSNGLVPDPERLPDIIKKHFTEQMADFVACPWSEGQGGDLNGEHSDLLTHDLTTLVGKQNNESFGGNNMDTQWKQVKRITLSSIKTLEDLTTWLEDLRDSETTLSQTVGTNLESVMLWVCMSHLYIISLLGFHTMWVRNQKIEPSRPHYFQRLGTEKETHLNQHTTRNLRLVGRIW